MRPKSLSADSSKTTRTTSSSNLSEALRGEDETIDRWTRSEEKEDRDDEERGRVRRERIEKWSIQLQIDSAEQRRNPVVQTFVTMREKSTGFEQHCSYDAWLGFCSSIGIRWTGGFRSIRGEISGEEKESLTFDGLTHPSSRWIFDDLVRICLKDLRVRGERNSL